MATKIMFENGNYVVVAADLERVAQELGAVFRNGGGFVGFAKEPAGKVIVNPAKVDYLEDFSQPPPPTYGHIT